MEGSTSTIGWRQAKRASAERRIEARRRKHSLLEKEGAEGAKDVVGRREFNAALSDARVLGAVARLRSRVEAPLADGAPDVVRCMHAAASAHVEHELARLGRTLEGLEGGGGEDAEKRPIGESSSSKIKTEVRAIVYDMDEGELERNLRRYVPQDEVDDLLDSESGFAAREAFEDILLRRCVRNTDEVRLDAVRLTEKERFESAFYQFPNGLCFAYDAIMDWDDSSAVREQDRGNLRVFAKDYAGVSAARSLTFTREDVRAINEQLKERYIATNPAACESGWLPKGSRVHWGSVECVGPKHHASEEIDASSDMYETVLRPWLVWLIDTLEGFVVGMLDMIEKFLTEQLPALMKKFARGAASVATGKAKEAAKETAEQTLDRIKEAAAWLRENPGKAALGVGVGAAGAAGVAAMGGFAAMGAAASQAAGYFSGVGVGAAGAATAAQKWATENPALASGAAAALTGALAMGLGSKAVRFVMEMLRQLTKLLFGTLRSFVRWPTMSFVLLRLGSVLLSELCNWVVARKGDSIRYYLAVLDMRTRLRGLAVSAGLADDEESADLKAARSRLKELAREARKRWKAAEANEGDEKAEARARSAQRALDRQYVAVRDLEPVKPSDFVIAAGDVVLYWDENAMGGSVWRLGRVLRGEAEGKEEEEEEGEAGAWTTWTVTPIFESAGQRERFGASSSARYEYQGAGGAWQPCGAQEAAQIARFTRLQKDYLTEGAPNRFELGEVGVSKGAVSTRREDMVLAWEWERIATKEMHSIDLSNKEELRSVMSSIMPTALVATLKSGRALDAFSQLVSYAFGMVRTTFALSPTSMAAGRVLSVLENACTQGVAMISETRVRNLSIAMTKGYAVYKNMSEVVDTLYRVVYPCWEKAQGRKFTKTACRALTTRARCTAAFRAAEVTEYNLELAFEPGQAGWEKWRRFQAFRGARVQQGGTVGYLKETLNAQTKFDYGNAEAVARHFVRAGDAYDPKSFEEAPPPIRCRVGVEKGEQFVDGLPIQFFDVYTLDPNTGLPGYFAGRSSHFDSPVAEIPTLRLSKKAEVMVTIAPCQWVNDKCDATAEGRAADDIEESHIKAAQTLLSWCGQTLYRRIGDLMGVALDHPIAFTTTVAVAGSVVGAMAGVTVSVAIPAAIAVAVVVMGVAWLTRWYTGEGELSPLKVALDEFELYGANKDIPRLATFDHEKEVLAEGASVLSPIDLQRLRKKSAEEKVRGEDLDLQSVASAEGAVEVVRRRARDLAAGGGEARVRRLLEIAPTLRKIGTIFDSEAVREQMWQAAVDGFASGLVGLNALFEGPSEERLEADPLPDGLGKTASADLALLQDLVQRIRSAHARLKDATSLTSALSTLMTHEDGELMLVGMYVEVTTLKGYAEQFRSHVDLVGEKDLPENALVVGSNYANPRVYLRNFRFYEKPGEDRIARWANEGEVAERVLASIVKANLPEELESFDESEQFARAWLPPVVPYFVKFPARKATQSSVETATAAGVLCGDPAARLWKAALGEKGFEALAKRVLGALPDTLRVMRKSFSSRKSTGGGPILLMDREEPRGRETIRYSNYPGRSTLVRVGATDRMPAYWKLDDQVLVVDGEAINASIDAVEERPGEAAPLIALMNGYFPFSNVDRVEAYIFLGAVTKGPNRTIDSSVFVHSSLDRLNDMIELNREEYAWGGRELKKYSR